MSAAVVVSCEHAGNRVPARYAHLFRDARPALDSHRGWDPGSLSLGRLFARRLQAPLVATTVTRLLVETNRSPRHLALFSEFSAPLDAGERRAVIERYYQPHRLRIETLVRSEIGRKGKVVHLGMHTFAPVLRGVERSADVGLLYDPARPLERQLCIAWRDRLLASDLALRVRRNYPYRGKADGLTTYFRRLFSSEAYAGIELEVNQRWVNGFQWRKLQRVLLETFRDARLALV